MSKLHHADRIIDVSILPDFSVDTVANSVWVSYIEGSTPRKTNAPDLVLDHESRIRIVQLLLSAMESLTEVKKQ